MTFREVVLVLLKRWWLVLLVPAVALPLLIVRARMAPYQATLNAVVLIPGDTETPGDSEKPELMVLDDLPSLVSSRVFAEAVAASAPVAGGELTVDDIQASLGATRYSRVLTITVTRDDREDVSAIGAAVASVLPNQVNTFLVADPAKPATVQIIDPPSAPTRSRPNGMLIIFALTLVAAAAGCALALVAEAWTREATTRTTA